MPRIRLYYSRQIFYLLLLITSKGICQKNYLARWYTSDNNELPQSSVKAIVADKYNFIWMATENGIVRYDGSTFLTYNSSNTKLKQSRFTQILGSVKKDSLYFHTTESKEVVLLNQRKIKVVKNNPSINTIFRNGQRYFIHDGLPSAKTTNQTERFCIKLFNGNLFFIDPHNVELCNANLKSIYRIAYKNNNVFNFSVINNTLYYVKKDGDFDCFSINGRSSGKLNPSLFKFGYQLYWNITAGQVFLCAKNKIYLVNAFNNHLTALPIVEFENFDKSKIISIYFDQKNQKLYLGSSTNGLCIISFPVFKPVKRNTTSTDVYYAAIPFNDHSLVTGSGIIMDNKRVTDSLPFTKKDAFNTWVSIAKDNNANMWYIRNLSVFCSLKKFDYKKHIEYNFEQAIKTIFCNQKNNIVWISLMSDEFNSKPRLFYIKNGIVTLAKVTNSNINFIAQYNNNTLYFGTEKGLFKYEISTNKLIFIKKTEKINIRSIYIDKEKKIWITTYEKGFFLYSDKILHSFPKDKNNYLNSSHCIIEDKRGFFWIPTNKGLFQVSKSALLKYSKNSTSVIYFHQYGKADGFLTNEFNGGCQPCGNFLKNDNITFPSMNGMVFFNPYKVNPVLPNKDIFIDNVIIDQKTFSPNDTIVLKNNFQRMRFVIAYAYYGNQENINIEAKLDNGAYGQWEKIGQNKSISFTTLPPGKYFLIIRALSGFDGEYKYKKIFIIVPEKFYQTLWFGILCIILSLVCIFIGWHIRLYYIKLKNKRLKQVIAKKTQKLKNSKNNLKNKIKQQETLVKSMSHDIKSPLKFLGSSIYNLYDEKQIQNDATLKRKLEAIHTSSVQLFEYVENLIKYSTIYMEGKKLEDTSYSLYDLIDEKIHIFKHMADAENTTIVNNVDLNLYIRTNRKVLSIIIHNLLDNALKNTKNGQIELQCVLKDNIIALTIMDNGQGMSKELIDYYLDFYKNPIVKNYHLGLHMIIELLIIIEGNINISSIVDQGTIIEIIVEVT